MPMFGILNCACCEKKFEDISQMNTYMKVVHMESEHNMIRRVKTTINAALVNADTILSVDSPLPEGWKYKESEHSKVNRTVTDLCEKDNTEREESVNASEAQQSTTKSFPEQVEIHPEEEWVTMNTADLNAQFERFKEEINSINKEENDDTNIFKC